MNTVVTAEAHAMRDGSVEDETRTARKVCDPLLSINKTGGMFLAEQTVQSYKEGGERRERFPEADKASETGPSNPSDSQTTRRRM